MPGREFGFKPQPEPRRFLPVGSQGYIVLRRTRRGLAWLKHIPGLRRFATYTEIWPCTVTKSEVE